MLVSQTLCDSICISGEKGKKMERNGHKQESKRKETERDEKERG